MSTRFLFVINPLSGGKSKHNFTQLVKDTLPAKYYSDFAFTEHKFHATEIVKKKFEDYDVFVAVGGDGTVNEVGSVLVNTNKLLGIIPYGSGNGLARALKIPINTKQALVRLFSGKSSAIDVGELNGQRFFNMAGIGFDAHISMKFAIKKERGPLGYAKATFAEISGYLPGEYTLTIDGARYEEKAFMISIANSSQYGNNAHVSPHASLKDGLLDVCIIKRFPLYHFPVMVYHMFSKTAHLSGYVKIIKGREIQISRRQEAPFHIDGEALNGGKAIEVRVLPLAINIIT